MKRPVHYTPPPSETLDQFAHAVCRQLGPDYHQGEIAHGLANFMKVLTRAYAKELNRGIETGELLDNEHKTP